MNNFVQQIDFSIESHSSAALRAYAHSYAKAVCFKALTAKRISLITYPIGVAQGEYSDKFIRVDAF